MTAATDPAGLDEFSQRMQREGLLGQYLCEHVWNAYGTFLLGDGEYEPADPEEVPGYEDDNETVLLRRKSDGQVFEVDIEVTMHPALTLEQRQERAALAAKLRSRQSALPFGAKDGGQS